MVNGDIMGDKYSVHIYIYTHSIYIYYIYIYIISKQNRKFVYFPMKWDDRLSMKPIFRNPKN